MFSVDAGWDANTKQDNLMTQLFGDEGKLTDDLSSVKSDSNPKKRKRKRNKDQEKKLAGEEDSGKKKKKVQKEVASEIDKENVDCETPNDTLLTEETLANTDLKKSKKKKKKKVNLTETEQTKQSETADNPDNVINEIQSTTEDLPKEKKKNKKTKASTIDDSAVKDTEKSVGNEVTEKTEDLPKKKKKNKKTEASTVDNSAVKDTEKNVENEVIEETENLPKKKKTNASTIDDSAVKDTEKSVENEVVEENNAPTNVDGGRSKRQRRKKKKKSKELITDKTPEISDKVPNEEEVKDTSTTVKDDNLSKKLSKFQQKMSRKLEGGHFRWINEKLYTTDSGVAEDMFKKQPNLFDVYHKGFESQVINWPENPVDLIIAYIKKQPSDSVIVDFGCGNAKLANSVPNKVHSFDLVAVNEHVKVADMKNVPVLNKSADIAVFSLALMGTNIADFISEANRVLKIGGTLKIAEVKSRFEDIGKFVNGVVSHGFQLLNKDEGNKMFVMFEFEKKSSPTGNLKPIHLKPCIYKRR